MVEFIFVITVLCIIICFRCHNAERVCAAQNYIIYANGGVWQNNGYFNYLNSLYGIENYSDTDFNSSVLVTTATQAAVMFEASTGYPSGKIDSKNYLVKRDGYFPDGLWSEQAGGVRITEKNCTDYTEWYVHWKYADYILYANGGEFSVLTEVGENECLSDEHSYIYMNPQGLDEINGFLGNIINERSQQFISKSGGYVYGIGTSPDGEDIVTNDKDKIISTDIREIYSEFYLLWGGETYIVEYNSNGGKGSMESQSMISGVEKKLSLNTYMKEGYTFSKWNTKSDGTGTSYSDGIGIRNIKEIKDGKVTLYAIWMPDENIEYKIEHYLQNDVLNGYELFYTEKNTGVCDKKIILSEFTKNYDGYIFNKFEVDGVSTEYTTILADGSRVVKIYYDRLKTPEPDSTVQEKENNEENNEIENDIKEESEKNTTENTIENATGNTIENTTGNTTGNTIENTTGNTSGNTIENASGNTIENTAGNTTESFLENKSGELNNDNVIDNEDSIAADSVNQSEESGNANRGNTQGLLSATITYISINGVKYRLCGKYARVTGVMSKNTFQITIREKIKVNGKTYKVKYIKSDAFKNCSMLKKIVIKSRYISQIGKNALKKINKNAVILVPKSKFKSYKKLFNKSTGYMKSMKILKIC